MTVPKVIQDIRDLKVLTDFLGINDRNIETLIDDQGRNLLSIHQSLVDLKVYMNDISAKIGVGLTKTNLSYLPVGSTCFLIESGIPTAYILAHKNYLSEDNIILVRKNTLPNRQYDSGNVSSYNGTYLNWWLLNEYKSWITGITFKDIAISILPVDGSATITSNKSVFLPSITELTGRSHPRQGSRLPEGSILDYFVDSSRRIPYSPSQILVPPATRSTNDAYSFYVLGTDGQLTSYGLTNTAVVNPRPLLSVASDNQVYILNESSTSNTLATATI